MDHLFGGYQHEAPAGSSTLAPRTSVTISVQSVLQWFLRRRVEKSEDRKRLHVNAPFVESANVLEIWSRMVA